MTTKTAVPAKQTPPARQLDSHRSHHESHHCDDCHRKETKQSPQKDTTSRDSCQQEHHDDAMLQRTQSEQTHQVHSTRSYEQAYQHGFRRSPLKLTDYFSRLQGDAQIQRRLEALENPRKTVFKVRLPPLPPMDVEPAKSTSTLLPSTAPKSATPTTVTLTTSLPPTAPMSVQFTPPTQPSLVITTQRVLEAALLARDLSIEKDVSFIADYLQVIGQFFKMQGIRTKEHVEAFSLGSLITVDDALTGTYEERKFFFTFNNNNTKSLPRRKNDQPEYIL
uniref:CCDC81 HU domain-containing protein n=1 Tax=Romanomermis culicivorax TaxID=13658 RepID=A0A915KJ30_ROMCU